MSELVCCVDLGSTFTKAALVRLDDGALLATAQHPTTLDTDLLDGWDACLRSLVEVAPGAAEAPVLACSSAGGGLRIAVVGNEELVTAEAGRRVALSSGGKVVQVIAAAVDGLDLDGLRASAPDVVLLVGGTDGGNADVLLASARTLAEARWSTPVVVAGNADAAAEVAALLAPAGTPFAVADNVLPRIGVSAPESARLAVRELFLSHVIGGKHLSTRPELGAMLRGATPDVVLTAVELLAEEAGDVLVVDVGGATTDVYSVVELDPEDAGLAREVVARTPATRTVEGDLGMRWSAPSAVAAADEAGFLDRPRAVADVLAQARHQHPDYLPDGEEALRFDARLASWALAVALRRHAGRAVVRYDDRGRVVERGGVDLREVRLLVASGGVLRHVPGAADLLTEHLVAEGGWQVPDRDALRVVVDHDYVLAAAGLLAADHPETARALLRRLR